jgi:hypothetical protein
MEVRGTKRGADGAEKQPFKVLHVRALPDNTQDYELVELVAPARVVRALILQDKHQAFIQMDSLETAKSVVAAFEANPPKIREKTVYLQFSNRNEVEGGNEPGMAPAAATPASGTIIIIAISEVTVPVSLDNIYQITKPYGDVLKIITFTKEANFQALVQYGTAAQANDARAYLDGKDLFQGCCHLRVSFSNRQSLVVRQNDLKSRDFTIPPPLTMSMGGLGPLIPPPMMGMHPGNPHLVPVGIPEDVRSSVLLVNKLDEEKTTCDVLFVLFGVYGDVQRVKIMFNKRATALVQMATAQQAEYARQNLQGCPLFGQNLQVATSKHQFVQLPRETDPGKDLTRDYTGHPHHRFAKKSFINTRNINQPSAVVHVANIHESVTDEELRDLFASHITSGHVPVVEFFKSSRTMAYVNCGTVEDGIMALISLHEFRFKEYPLRISFSHKDPNAMNQTA